MDCHTPVLAGKHRLETQVKAAARVAHFMSSQKPNEALDIMTLLAASRQVEANEEMRQAMALAACAACKTQSPV